MKCPKCQSEIEDNSKFCCKCGVNIESAVQEVAQAQQVATSSQERLITDDALEKIIEQETDQVEEDHVEQNQVGEDQIEEDQEVVKVQKGYKQYIRYGIIGTLATLGLTLLTLLIIVNVYSKNSQVGALDNSQQVDGQVQETQIEALSFLQNEISLNSKENKKLQVEVYPKQADETKLIWSSSHPEDISIDQTGLVTAVKEGAKATITVKDANTQMVKAECEVNVLSKKETFLNTVYWLNSNEVTLDKINVYEENYAPNKRDTSLQWDETLFYKLEEIDQSSDKDGYINYYSVEKKQLINEETGNLMEYEIYINPDNNEVNKIVSIEYIGDQLEIVDYYYDKGKVSFIFKREDSVYTPTYASPDKIGERYYFNNDVLVKWRVINEPLKVNDYALQGGANIIAYDTLPDEKKQYFDTREVKMLNAAYNTYNTVLQARSIGYIKGYVTSINGEPMADVEVRVLSDEYNVLVGNALTNSEGNYNIPVPSNGGTYRIVITKPGYIVTTIYDIDMNSQFLGAYQESVYLIPNNNTSYNIQILLSDAFNKLTVDNSFYDSENGYYGMNDMIKLSGATLNIRTGINNKTGSIYTTTYADDYGLVNVYLPAGVYTGEIIKNGYITSYFTITARYDNDFIQSNTTPVLGDDEVRIVLTWGDTPSDLDSHLFTPYQGEDGDMQHIGYSQRDDGWGNNLDVDDTTSYGPETITISNLSSGSYKYYVADYSNCAYGNSDSYEMSLSGAKVSVYTKDGLVQMFNVPRNKSGVIWEVFEIRNKKVVPIQRYYNNITDKPWWNSSKW